MEIEITDAATILSVILSNIEIFNMSIGNG
jgi:hypothetical protein